MESDICDIRKIVINSELPPARRKEDFALKLGDPYKHKVGEITVNSVFDGDMPLGEVIGAVINR